MLCYYYDLYSKGLNKLFLIVKLWSFPSQVFCIGKMHQIFVLNIFLGVLS